MAIGVVLVYADLVDVCDSDVLLTTYEMIIAEKAALSRFFWEYLIVDEAHRLKNENRYLLCLQSC
eukprot:SAG25_NODE_203_length_11965_cov_47.109641_8_plen_65_part_00